ncbi:MAG: hypothetical protein C7B45_06280 [Sulfobacillus acidophilus]|uniref:Uncharacterized protein n=1 Tax=Sulfobacillus acidophilus TaxID=53633 RepID=A0A2T2WJX9_9FIRM|nr:MAG: hypothetical protein C7B45_06280 [Sulfobacillus acidophilus]
MEAHTTHAIQYLDAQIDKVRRAQARMVESLRQEIGSVRQELDNVDTKFDDKPTSLQYWYCGTPLVPISGLVTLFATRP